MKWNCTLITKYIIWGVNTLEMKTQFINNSRNEKNIKTTTTQSLEKQWQWEELLLLLLSLQSRPTLCDPIDSSPLGSAVPGILHARPLEWVAISFSIAWKWKVKVKSLSRDRLMGTPWTVAHQAPPSMGFSRQEYWSGLPLPSPDNESSTNQN